MRMNCPPTIVFRIQYEGVPNGCAVECIVEQDIDIKAFKHAVIQVTSCPHAVSDQIVFSLKCTRHTVCVGREPVTEMVQKLSSTTGMLNE